MALFKTVELQEVYNTLNPPVIGKDRWGIDIKALMIDVNTNELFILGYGNEIIPLSTKYASIYTYTELKKQIESITGNINKAFVYRGKDDTITAGIDLSAKYPYASNGDVYTIANTTEWVCIGNNHWEELGINYDYITHRFIPSGCTFNALTGYIVINEWNKLVSACTPGVYNALNTIIDNYNNQHCSNFTEFFNYCINAGEAVSTTMNLAIKNAQAINTLSGDMKVLVNQLTAYIDDVISTQISAQLSTQVSAQISGTVIDYIQKNSVTKTEYSTLSSSYELLKTHVVISSDLLAEALNMYEVKFKELEDTLTSCISG